MTERHLQCVWFDERLRPTPLATDCGETVTVESPGDWNLGPGPDFTGARLRIMPGNRRVHGDVEIHIHPRDWMDHKHGNDPLYRRVVAHVTFTHGMLPAGSLPTGTMEIGLRDALKRNPYFSFDQVDVTAYPYRSTIAEAPPCRHQLQALGTDSAIAFLESAGQERLRLKTERMASRISGNDRHSVLYEEIMGALGYRHNVPAFRALARAVSPARLAESSGGDPAAAYSVLLGVSGLLPDRMPAQWDDETVRFVRKLWDHWWPRADVWADVLMPRDSWRLAGLRPQNNPARRMAAAASIFCKPDRFVSALSGISVQKPARWLAKAAQLIHSSSTSAGYWDHRLAFGGKPVRSPVALIGPDRAASIATNILIPYLAATGHDISPLLSGLPREHDNEIVKRMVYWLFGRDYPDTVTATGLRQQGFLQVFYDYCVNRRTCADCRLATDLES